MNWKTLRLLMFVSILFHSMSGSAMDELEDETALFPSPPPAKRLTARANSQETLKNIPLFQIPMVQATAFRIGILADTAIRVGVELSTAFRIGYQFGVLGIDGEFGISKTKYGAIHTDATSTENSGFPSGGALEEPVSELNRSRGEDDSWSTRRMGVGISASGNLLNNPDSHFFQKGRFGISRVSATDERYALDFSGWWFSVEASFPYQPSKKRRTFLAPFIRHEWAFVHRDGAELPSYRRLSLQRLSMGVELSFAL